MPTGTCNGAVETRILELVSRNAVPANQSRRFSRSKNSLYPPLTPEHSR